MRQRTRAAPQSGPANFWRSDVVSGQLSPAMARPNLDVVRAQLRGLASDAIADALETLESRVLGGPARGGRAGRERQLARTREVLERDRALASATLSEEVPRPSPPPAAAIGASNTALDAIVCDEPIRTRSMAQLLAAQGHPERALSIYAYLLARDGSNPALHAEAAALREAQPSAGVRTDLE